ncbi:SAM-dependent methyltransferase ['Fragaria x ananassa' phyllody phytoplasma]|uniref:SAM-dependent methyltransferase n=1 Tax='Fragaria x ananassa' phyllody phytoplasma TaxID=2358428 RepID=A0ABS5K345_9MOLU|nr:SAM-dependent methyltransferase ['Fragaria x ananassa' phyllody phytoplasma]MBS2126288.1 SAM-dependent methyltransferase ['Fragaria x ananassa' phyllody phytoplasma]
MMFNKTKHLTKLKKYAKDHHIPILQDTSLTLILQIIEQYQIKNILEIGTAIGYSALAISNENTTIDTLERDFLSYHLAKNFLQNAPFQINVIWAEGLIYPLTCLTVYDLILIDAAKSQYQKLFLKYCSLLRPQGIIICDNLHLNAFLSEQNSDPPKRKHKGILKKMYDFKVFLENHSDFTTIFHNIGDGLSVSYIKR